MKIICKVKKKKALSKGKTQWANNWSVQQYMRQRDQSFNYRECLQKLLRKIK